MKKSVVIFMRCMPVMLILAMGWPPVSGALAKAQPAYVLPGAFGESIDTLGIEAGARCEVYANRALAQMRLDFAKAVGQTGRDGYLQILQTTVILIGEQPAGLIPAQEEIWAEYYAEAICLVSFVVMDNTMNIGDLPYAEVVGRMGDYLVQKDGTVEALPLRQLRSRFLTDPVLPGMRVINLGSQYNAVYEFPYGGQTGIPLLEYLAGSELTAFAEAFETDFPVSVSVRHDGEASGVPHTSTDPVTIRAVFEALRGITVLDTEGGTDHTDDYLNYYFEMADGRLIGGFVFQDGALLDEWLGQRKIEGFDALQRALPDPGYY